MEHVVQALNSLRSTEIMSYLQYMQHQYMAVSLLSPGMKTEFQARLALEETPHALRQYATNMTAGKILLIP